MLNQSYLSNASVASCITHLQQNLASSKVNSTLISESSNKCDIISSGNAVYDSDCMNQLLGSGNPFISVNVNATTHISYRGAYGNELSTGGSAVSGSECYLSLLFK